MGHNIYLKGISNSVQDLKQGDIRINYKSHYLHYMYNFIKINIMFYIQNDKKFTLSNL